MLVNLAKFTLYYVIVKNMDSVIQVGILKSSLFPVGVLFIMSITCITTVL